MFHLIGCRHDEGMAEFDRLFRTARHRRRFSECSLLLDLVREYDPLLAPAERALLNYHEGKIAIDIRQWESALPILRSVVDDAHADVRLRTNAEVRIGNAIRQLQRPDEARVVLERALARIDENPGAERSRWRVYYELGEIERDLGHVDRAGTMLAQALALAHDDDEDADIAGVRNSLGTVQLRLRNIDGAIASFQASLEELRQRGDVLRQGTVLNNLGLAQLERCDWAAAEATFATSLEIKREAGDLLGQATTLLNLSRTKAAQDNIADALKSAAEAEALFGRGNDLHGQALARQTCERLRQRESGAVLSEASAKKRGSLPWWAWVTIALGFLIALGALLAVFSD
jgi:tetratricopeptide (TPR) repeat protein